MRHGGTQETADPHPMSTVVASSVAASRTQGGNGSANAARKYGPAEPPSINIGSVSAGWAKQPAARDSGALLDAFTDTNSTEQTG